MFEIVRSAKAARPLAGPSNSGDTFNVIATPPATPAKAVDALPGRDAYIDRPRPSVEVDPITEASMPTVDTNDASHVRRPRDEPPTPISQRRRKRSPTALPVYNPALPQHRDGRPDNKRISDRRQGIKDAEFIVHETGKNLRRAARAAESVGDKAKAGGYWDMAEGVDEVLEQLDAWIQKQQERIQEESSDFAEFGSSLAMRDQSTTLSPGFR